MPGDQRFLRTIRPRNILSFGPDTQELELRSLNVLIGPNGAGKSNLIEVIGLLQAAPGNLPGPIQAGGGIAEWLWKGADGADAASVPRVQLDVTVTSLVEQMPLRHGLELSMFGQRFQLVNEAIEDDHTWPGESNVIAYYRSRYGNAEANLRTNGTNGERTLRKLRAEDLASDQSVLSQRKDPDQYPEITYLGNQYAKIRMFREWNLGRNAPPRRPQPTDLPGDFLREDAANIALVLNDLEQRPGFKSMLVEKLRNADESIADLSTRILGGTVQLFLYHYGLTAPVPATRLSDGTVRYLCLLSVLCHPAPPPLVCLEEPELGLHPDLLPGLADLLVEASQRMQLIVTTHSDTLIDGLTKFPETVVVCEKRAGSTVMSRRTGPELTQWLSEYGLGQLWRRGEIGGNRW